MEVISNLLQAAVTLLGFFLGGIRYLKSRKQEYFLLTCFYFSVRQIGYGEHAIFFTRSNSLYYRADGRIPNYSQTALACAIAFPGAR